MIRFGIRCKWFGFQVLLGGRKFGQWHDHDWNAVSLFPGRLIEETVDGTNTHWFAYWVPYTHVHRVRFPWAMLVVHGRKIQDHYEMDGETYQDCQPMLLYATELLGLIQQSNEELGA